MNEFIARSTFVFVIIAVYFIGLFLSTHLQSTYNITLELKYILPIISLAYFDYWMRLFSRSFYKFHLLDTVLNNKHLKCFMSFNPYTTLVKNFKIVSINGFRGISPIIEWTNPATKRITKFYLPEDFSVNLDSCNGIVDFSLIAKFRIAPKPIFHIRNLQFFFLKL